MFLARFLAVGAVVATVACSNSTPTTPNPAGQVPAPGMPGVQTPNPPPSGTVGVTIQDFSFSPASLTIKTGTTVRWSNRGPSAHTTVSDMGTWNSGVLNVGGTFDFTFMQPGTFPYHCSLHPPSLYPGFIGTVTVTQ
jgi:plastocyanin